MYRHDNNEYNIETFISTVVCFVIILLFWICFFSVFKLFEKCMRILFNTFNYLLYCVNNRYLNN